MIGKRGWETATEGDTRSLGKWKKRRKTESETLKRAAEEPYVFSDWMDGHTDKIAY